MSDSAKCQIRPDSTIDCVGMHVHGVDASQRVFRLRIPALEAVICFFYEERKNEVPIPSCQVEDQHSYARK